MIKMTSKHRLFVEAYTGNATEAMKNAGFTGTDRELEKGGNELLQDPTIKDAIRQRSLYSASTTKLIADRNERQAFWSSIMRNDDPNHKQEYNDKNVPIVPGNLPLPMRLKASELLGKSETDFIERLDMNHNISISDVIKESYTIDNDNLEAIEAQYEVLYNRKKQQQNAEEDEGMVDEQSGGDELLSSSPTQPSLGDFL